MRFTIKQLQYFDTALRTGSIAKASSEMNISQSSITAAIDAIESVSKAELLRRMPAKGIAPTEKGIEAGKRIRSFLEQARVFEADLLTLTGDPAGTLRLGCYAPTAPHVLPPLLKRISKEFPEIRVEIKEGDFQSLAEDLNNGVVDIGLTYRRAASRAQPFLPMFVAKPVALVPDTWDLAKKESVSLQDLTELPMILLDLPGAPEYFEGLFTKENLRINVVHSTKSSSVLRGLVAAELGYTILNVCGPLDRANDVGYVAKRIQGDLQAPTYGVASTAASQKSSLVRAVLKTCDAFAKEGGFRHLLSAEAVD
ncbi:LysR family transcriptional regulator [Cognatishimia sp.]|uniref:LysR family transcriptional regulator n=1 Tax=Cognatishimia sp. TaxID=2211648 RepID=UPI003511AC74